MRTDLPLWLRSADLTVLGFDEEEEDEEESEEEESEEDEEEDDESEDEEEDDDEEEEDEEDEKSSKSKKTSKVDGLKSALSKERKARREASKQAKALQRELDALKGDKDTKDDKEKSKGEKDKANKELDSERQKGEKLAVKFATNAVDTALVKIAGEAKMPQFRDIDDVVRLVDREEIDIEQDEDDPSDVDVDEETVRDALKALAKKKPHLLLGKDEAKKRTASKFNNKKTSKSKTQEELRRKYPALAKR